MSNTSKISRSLIAALITVCMLLSCIPFTRTVRADSGETFYLYVKVELTESGTETVTDAYYADSYTAPEDGFFFLCAVYSGYQNLTVPGDYTSCLNGSTASFNGEYDSFSDYLLLDSTLRFTDITVKSRQGTGLFGYGDNVVGWANDMLDHVNDTYIYLVDDQQSFSLKTPGNGEGNVFETDDLTVKGSFSIANNQIKSDKPNVLRIVKGQDKDGSLIAGSGSITGSGNARLEIGDHVLVKGGLKLFKADGTPAYDFENETGFYYHTDGTKGFIYDATLGGWKLDEGGNGGGEDPVVYDDPVGGDNVYFIFIDNDKLGELEQHQGDENYNPNFKESDFKIVANTFAPQDGYSWYALFLNGVTGYDITTKNTPLKEGRVKILANNSLVIAGECYGAAFELYGQNSRIEFTGTTVTTGNNEVYTGGFTEAMPIVNFVSGLDLAGSYLYTFTSDRTIETDAYMGQVLINSGVKLTIGNNSSTPNTESAVVWADVITVKGTLEIVHREPGENIWPNELHIVPDGALHIEDGGSLIGGSNSILALERGASISGFTVYAEDGTTVLGSSSQNLEQSEAFVNSNGKWVRTDFGGPNNDFEGLQVRYDDHVIDKVEYSTDGVNYSDLPERNVFGKDDIPNVIYFKVSPKSGEEEREFEMGYIDGPDFETDERDWQWTFENAHIISGKIIFAVEKTTITKDQFIVDFHTKGGGFNENYEGIEVRFDGGRIAGVQYSVDNGTFKDVPEDHIIPKDTVDSCTTSIRFKVTPKQGEENRNYVLDYVDGPDYSVGDETWVRERVEHDNGENYIFTINKTAITKNQFVVDIFADDGGNPPQPQDGMQVNYDNNDIIVNSYYFDNDSEHPVSLNNFFIPKEDLAGHSSVTFLYTLNGIKAVDPSRMLQDNSNQDFTISDIGKTSLKVTKNGDNWPDYCEVNFATGDNVFHVTVQNAPEQPEYGVFSSNDAVTQKQENGNCDFSFNLDNVGTDTFTITPKEGYVIWKLEIQGDRDENVKYDQIVKLEQVSGTNTYKIVYIDANNKLNMNERFAIRVDYRFNDASIVNDIVNNRGGYAYYTEATRFDEIAVDLKNCLTTEIYCYYRYEYSEDYPTVASVASSIIVESKAVETDASDPVGLPFVRFSLSLNGEVSNPFKVYILDGPYKYIIKTCVDDKNTEDIADDVYEYYIADATSQYSIESGRDMVLSLNYVGVPVIFGNGAASVGVLMSDSDDIFSCHVTQDASNVDLHYPTTPDGDETFPANSVGSISSRLIIVKASEGASAVIVQGEIGCLGWDFGKIETFSANEIPSRATEANIYIRNDFVWIKSVSFDNTDYFEKITGVYVDTTCGVQDGTVVAQYVSEGTYKLTFKTDYDLIRLRIEFDDGSGTVKSRYITLHRVALQISDRLDSNFRQSLVTGGQPNYDLPEGDWDRRIFASYSYKEGTSLANLKLAVTITYDDGTTEFKIIKGTEYLDYGLATDERANFDRGYADFVVWKGSESEFRHIKSVEIIVSEDNTDTFGGVVVGSGRGVVWNQEDA